ncbi:MAG: sigma-70 family RNA polymerase sigma factor [Planctomycetota bacterium]
MPDQRANDDFDFQAFLRSLQAGEPTAANRLFAEYSERLVKLAAKNIHPALIKRFDGEDVVQSVFRSFYRRQEEGQFQIEHSQQLWQLLVTLTLCKTRSHARRHTADRRDARADHTIADQAELLDRHPSDAEALLLWEEIDTVLVGLPERTAEIIAMRLEGMNRSAIAKRLDLSRQTIHRILKLVQQRLQDRLQTESENLA